MASYEAKTKIFSGEKFPQIFHDEVPLGQVLLYNCLKYSDKVIQIYADNGVQLTCGQMSDMMKQVAVRLQQLDLRFGDVVGFLARNSTFLAPAVFGCILLGLPINPLFVSLDAEEIVRVYRQTQPRLVFCDSDQVEKIEVVLRTLNIAARVVTVDERFKVYDHIEDYFESSQDSNAFNSIPQKFDLSTDKVCAAIMTSSGSTGASKLVQVSQAQLLESMFAINGFADEMVFFTNGPLPWISGLCQTVHSVLNQHTRVTTGRRLMSKEYVDFIAKYKPNQIGMSPTEVFELCEYLESNSGDLDCLKLLSTGGWTISEKALKQIEGFMPNGRVVVNYGLTEAAGCVARTDISEPANGSVGKLCPNVQVKILLEDGSFGGIRDVGEILLKIPFSFLGYLNDEKQTKAFIDEDSWMHTEDIGYFDEACNLFYVGRKKFMIRCCNRRVNPMEIEEIIATLPGVQKVCVVALPDIDVFEVACAVVERNQTLSIAESDIVQAVGHLEDHKQLKGGVFFVEKLQVTVTGKLNRGAIEATAMAMAKLA